MCGDPRIRLGKRRIRRCELSCLDPRLHALAGLLCNFELNRALRFLLDDHRSRRNMLTMAYIKNAKLGQVACSQLAINFARLNIARSRRCRDSWSRTWIAQISGNFSGAFCPVNLPLIHGALVGWVTSAVSMTLSFQMKGVSVCASRQRSVLDPEPTLESAPAEGPLSTRQLSPRAGWSLCCSDCARW